MSTTRTNARRTNDTYENCSTVSPLEALDVNSDLIA